jgi:uncharacterized protein
MADLQTTEINTSCREPDFPRDALRAFSAFVTNFAFPCLGAKAAFNAGSCDLQTYDQLASASSTAALSVDLRRFVCSNMRQASAYATFVAIFRGPLQVSEKVFERLLWSQLSLLNRIDAKHSAWSDDVASDPADPRFSFSFCGHALYVVGLHGNSSRKSRQFRFPTLVFNPHKQFERLRSEGKWKRMQTAIRDRDTRLQGATNPMLSDFGESSEARQYSGRAVEETWRAPFEAEPAPAGCPFKHPT